MESERFETNAVVFKIRQDLISVQGNCHVPGPLKILSLVALPGLLPPPTHPPHFAVTANSPKSRVRLAASRITSPSPGGCLSGVH